MFCCLKSLPLFTFLIFASSSLLRGAEPGVAVEKIDAAVVEVMKKQHVPGVAIAVVHKGDVLVAKGYGEANVEHHVPVKAETVFQTASVGKQFTAAAVMTLVDDGKLSLDDPITKFFVGVPRDWPEITVRHLLTHTSGIPNYDSGVFDFRKDYTEDDFAKLIFTTKLEFTPGSRWNYSNPGYVLLGCIIHKVTGRPYGELLSERVFKPLGMKTARVMSEADIVPHRAAGYRRVDGELKNQDWVSPAINTTADGALYVSILDMIAWDKGLRDKAVLKPESWQQVFTPVALSDGSTFPYGFGWFIDEHHGQPRHHHAGAWQGFRTYITRYLKDDLSVIVLTNLADATPEAFAEGIVGLFDSQPSKDANK
jgi:CubicO group peptidase (beta-lactamase class C family)